MLEKRLDILTGLVGLLQASGVSFTSVVLTHLNIPIDQLDANFFPLCHVLDVGDDDIEYNPGRFVRARMLTEIRVFFRSVTYTTLQDKIETLREELELKKLASMSTLMLQKYEIKTYTDNPFVEVCFYTEMEYNYKIA